ncbi:MATE family efflux transporter [Lysinibacillus sp. M3]|uniref:Probable multidrug resistance protein NorM n=1 Tax=Lysinibacillus zambalensis TaxID=3160866 RepID=A0ABV1ML52_9BACI
MVTKDITGNLTLKQKIMIVLALAIPAMIENILQTVVGFVDTLFVAKLGVIEVTAVGIANAVLAVYIALFMALSVGTSSLIARRIGAEDIEGAKTIARNATWISLLIGLILGVVTFFFNEPLLQIMGASDEVIGVAVPYFKIVGIPAFLISFMFTFGSILRATGDTKTPMTVSIWINVLHIVLDYLLIFGIGKFAGLGVEGAAWATVIVRLIGAIRLFQHIQRSEVAFNLLKAVIPDSNKWTRELLKVSLPTAAERLIMRMGQVLYFGLIVRIGTETYAAHTMAGNIEAFAYMPGYGLAVAATTLVGQCYGAEKFKEARSYGYITSIIGIIFMAIIGAIIFVLAPWLASWFTTDPTILDMVVTALRISAVSQPALAIGLVLAGALQGLGDTKSPMYSTAIGMWIIRIIGVYILGIHLNLGIAGVWYAIIIDYFARAFFLAWKFNRHFRVIKNEE